MLWKNLKKLLMILVDIGIIWVSYLLANLLSDELHVLRGDLVDFAQSAFIITVVYVILNYIMDLYSKVWRYAGLDEVVRLLASAMTSTLLVMGLSVALHAPFALDVHIVAGVFIFFMTTAYRFLPRIYESYAGGRRGKPKAEGVSRVLIIGAGQAGASLVKEMRMNRAAGYVPVGFVDDDYLKVGNIVSGIKVVGSRDVIPEVVSELSVDVILLAINSLDSENKREILEICKGTGCELRIMPSIIGMIGQKVSIENIQRVDLEDLLGRDPVKLDSRGIEEYIKGRTILVTGAAGSIGSQLCRDILKFSPKELVCLDIHETGMFHLENEFRELKTFSKLSFVIASIRDFAKLKLVFREYRPEVVFHAAALKHVPLMEHNPAEAVKTNILGTRNLALLSDAYGVHRFVQISTDKAVNPTNVMGATKRVCELFLQALNSRSETEFVAVRFGNVLGSAGSVVPFFVEQIKRGGPVTVTHEEITRFFMTIPEASQLVIQCGVFAEGGELFVLDMGEPVRIYDLATDLIWLSGLKPNEDIKIEITGLRPGEKLFEETLRDDEGLSKTANEKIFVSKPLSFDYGELNAKIDGFVPLFEREDRSELIMQLRSLAPSFVPFERRRGGGSLEPQQGSLFDEELILEEYRSSVGEVRL